MLQGVEAAGCITFEEHTLLLSIACCPNDTKCMLGQLVIERGAGQVTDVGALGQGNTWPYHFSDCPTIALPQLPTAPPQFWDIQTWLGRFLPSGVLHSTARGDSSTISSKVSVLEPTWHRGQKQTCQPRKHEAHDTLWQKLQDSPGGVERRRQSDRLRRGSRAGNAEHPGGQLAGRHSLRAP